MYFCRLKNGVMCMDIKKCTKCGVDKELSEFHNCGKKKDGKKSRCKICRNEDKKIYRDKNIEEIKRKDKIYGDANKDKKRAYRDKNIEKIKIRDKIYYEKNKGKIKIYLGKNKEKIGGNNKKYVEKNKKRLNEIRVKRRKENPLLKLSSNIRTNIASSFKRKGWTKKSKTRKILECDFKTFEKYLNDNPYFFKVGDSNLQLDHIIPINNANTEEEIFKLNHYTNFQLLPSEYNQNIKKDKPWDKNHFEQWLSENIT